MALTISLESKTAIVTGAARGIGRAIATQLAQAGARLVLCDVDRGALTDAINHIGGEALALDGDLTQPKFPDQIVRAAVDTFGSIDIVVNNAGYTWDNVIQKTTDAQFQTMLDIHAVAPFRLLRAASEWLRDTAKREKEAGILAVRKVVNITSISGLDGNAGQAAYASGKAAVVGLTKSLAKEWGRYNVTVNAVGFALIETRLTKPMDDPDTDIDVGGRHVRVGMQGRVREQVLKAIPLGRFGTVQDAPNTVFFFCSPLSDYVTGEVLVCGGGLRF